MAAALSRLESDPPPVEAIVDVAWFVNFAPSEMGEGSNCGAMLDAIAQGRELLVDDPSYMHGKLPGSYGRSLSASRWEEFVLDPRGHVLRGEGRGYVRQVWGEKPKQTRSARQDEFGQEQIDATVLARNVAEVLALVPNHARGILLTHHTSRQYGPTMRRVFGEHVRLAPIMPAAKVAYRDARLAHEKDAAELAEIAERPRPFTREDAQRWARASRKMEMTLPDWLEAVAERYLHGKGRAGEKGVIEATRVECDGELKAAYDAYEAARWKLYKEARDADEARQKLAREAGAVVVPFAFVRWYPYQSADRRARALSLMGP